MNKIIFMNPSAFGLPSLAYFQFHPSYYKLHDYFISVTRKVKDTIKVLPPFLQSNLKIANIISLLVKA